MDSLETDLKNLEKMFIRSDKQDNIPKTDLRRWLYIPVEKRMQILRDLMQPYARKNL